MWLLHAMAILNFMRTILLGVVLSASTALAQAPWQMQDSGTTASLRGIHSPDGKSAWASGTEGTVLRTLDGGAHWTRCSTPDADKDGAALDFRGVQAFDQNSAIVMASGPGEKSRLYKTTDGCKTWSLLLKNTDPDGFFDALLLNRFDKDGYLLGDPVHGEFGLWTTEDKGSTWQRSHLPGLKALQKEGAFAASNTSLFVDKRYGLAFVSGGVSGARIFFSGDSHEDQFTHADLPIASGTEGAGGFSIEARDGCCRVVVGGDYTKPNQSKGTAAYTVDGGKIWKSAERLPHGYRSAVQWSEALKLWITVGTNGSDFSHDDGRSWQPLDNGNWNALSLPFVVGPKGRIAKLNPEVFSGK